MSDPPSRIRSILNHLRPHPAAPVNFHTLSPTTFLERAASIEPDAEAIFHITVNGAVLRRSYAEFADRARGLAYYFLKHGYRRVGILAPNTPAFLESIYGIVAAGAVIVPTNYRLKQDDIAYIFDFAEVDCIIVDNEFVGLLDAYKEKHQSVPLIVDMVDLPPRAHVHSCLEVVANLARQDTDATEGQLSGPFDEAVLEGLKHDIDQGSHGWAGLHAQARSEDDMLAIPFTSGTTSRPKGVVYTHRGAYLAALANIIESGLNIGRCKYLWTLPM
ncbi:AMP-binding protein [Fusarium fujikuroi]|nr:AMP-binding protein [Fusarium fujikuroi]